MPTARQSRALTAVTLVTQCCMRSIAAASRLKPLAKQTKQIRDAQVRRVITPPFLHVTPWVYLNSYYYTRGKDIRLIRFANTKQKIITNKTDSRCTSQAGHHSAFPARHNMSLSKLILLFVRLDNIVFLWIHCVDKWCMVINTKTSFWSTAMHASIRWFRGKYEHLDIISCYVGTPSWGYRLIICCHSK